MISNVSCRLGTPEVSLISLNHELLSCVSGRTWRPPPGIQHDEECAHTYRRWCFRSDSSYGSRPFWLNPTEQTVPRRNSEKDKKTREEMKQRAETQQTSSWIMQRMCLISSFLPEHTQAAVSGRSRWLCPIMRRWLREEPQASKHRHSCFSFFYCVQTECELSDWAETVSLCLSLRSNRKHTQLSQKHELISVPRLWALFIKIISTNQGWAPGKHSLAEL